MKHESHANRMLWLTSVRQLMTETADYHTTDFSLIEALRADSALERRSLRHSLEQTISGVAAGRDFFGNMPSSSSGAALGSLSRQAPAPDPEAESPAPTTAPEDEDGQVVSRTS